METPHMWRRATVQGDDNCDDPARTRRYASADSRWTKSFWRGVWFRRIVRVKFRLSTAACLDGRLGVVFVVHGTRKFIQRAGPGVTADKVSSTTKLGSWYATALFWKPQVALFVNESTLPHPAHPARPRRRRHRSLSRRARRSSPPTASHSRSSTLNMRRWPTTD